MTIMKLSEKITIVVPCKNEEGYISYLLDSLRSQDIGDTRILIADCSTDNTRQVIRDNSHSLNVEIIKGGTTSGETIVSCWLDLNSIEEI